jgi:hypothetical protein
MKNLERLVVFLLGFANGWLVYTGWTHLRSRQAVLQVIDGGRMPVIQRSDDPMRCYDHLNGVWAFPGSEARLEARNNQNGQLELLVDPARTRAPRNRWTWSASSFWQNATNWNDLSTDGNGNPIGGYCRLELGADCRSLTALCYPAGTNPSIGGQPQSTVHASFTRPVL